MQHERTTTDARRLRLHQVEHHLHGDGRIDGAAALGQDGRAGLHGQRVGRSDHVLVGIGDGLGRV